MSTSSPIFYIKTNRVFNKIKKFSWVLVPLIAFGGLFYPRLGLLLIPIMLTIITLGFFKGKYWCGNLCPHGSLFDSIIMHFSFNKKIPNLVASRTLKVLFFIWYMSMFVNRIIKVSALWGTMAFVDKLGFVFAVNYLIPTTVGTILALFVSPRAWCSFCPMGTMEQLAYKLGKFTKLNSKTDQKVSIAAKEQCHKCGKCSRVCPMQLKPYLDFSANSQFENENCIRCSTCIANCPAGILSLENSAKAMQIKESANNEGYERRQRIIAVVEKVNPLADDVIEYTFKFKQPAKVNYQAGQFILLKILDNPEMFRAYSISSYNEDGTRLSVTIKKFDNGFGTSIIYNNFREGDKVELEGPMGRELVVDKKTTKVLLVAGGMGITPFVPIVRDLLENKHSVRELKLIYGVNKENEFLYDDYFTALAAKYSNFAYYKTVAFPQENWEGHRGFVTDVMLNLSLEGYRVYMCGPKPMVNAAIKSLRQKGVEEKNIFAESA